MFRRYVVLPAAILSSALSLAAWLLLAYYSLTDSWQQGPLDHVVDTQSGRPAYGSTLWHDGFAIKWGLVRHEPLPEPLYCPDPDNPTVYGAWDAGLQGHIRHWRFVGVNLFDRWPGAFGPRSELYGFQRGMVISYWYVLAATTALPLACVPYLARKRRRVRRVLAGACGACGYDLRASGERCPECGTPVTPLTSRELARLALLRRVTGAVRRSMGDLVAPLVLFLVALVLLAVGESTPAWVSRFGARPGPWIFERRWLILAVVLMAAGVVWGLILSIRARRVVGLLPAVLHGVTLGVVWYFHREAARRTRRPR